MWQVIEQDGPLTIMDCDGRVYIVDHSDAADVIRNLLAALDGVPGEPARDGRGVLAQWEFDDSDWQPGEECLTAGERQR